MTGYLENAQSNKKIISNIVKEKASMLLLHFYFQKQSKTKLSKQTFCLAVTPLASRGQHLKKTPWEQWSEWSEAVKLQTTQLSNELNLPMKFCKAAGSHLTHCYYKNVYYSFIHCSFAVSDCRFILQQWFVTSVEVSDKRCGPADWDVTLETVFCFSFGRLTARYTTPTGWQYCSVSTGCVIRHHTSAMFISFIRCDNILKHKST